MKELVMTSFKLPASVEERMLQSIVSQGYGLRGKSKWIVESIEGFLQKPDFHELVEIAGDMGNLTRPTSLRLSRELNLKIDEAVLEVRKIYPAMEGVRSNIIRASIIQRML